MSVESERPPLPHPWLRGPVPGVPRELQGVAHALQQTLEEVEEFTAGFPDALLYVRPAGLAHTAFHLRHIAGVIDRLFTTSRGEAVSQAQRDAAAGERSDEPGATTAELVASVRQQVERALEQLRDTDVTTLHEERLVGSKRLPSTAYGLLFHAAEHAQRHCGQLLVTVRVVQQAADRSAP